MSLRKACSGPNAWIVQARADAVRFCNLTVVVLQDVSAVAVQHTWAAALQRGRVLATFEAFTRRFNANQACVLVVDVGVENTHGVGAAAHTRNDCIGLLAVQACLRQKGWHLLKAFVANDTLKIANHHGVGVWASHGANDVKGVVDIGHPVAHGFVQGVFEGFAA